MVKHCERKALRGVVVVRRVDSNGKALREESLEEDRNKYPKKKRSYAI